MDPARPPDSDPVLTYVVDTDPLRRAWPEIDGLATTLGEATRILQSVKAQVASLRRRAYTDGHAAGFASAQADAVRHLIEAQQSARRFVSASDAHIVWLAVSILERIAPDLGEANLVAALAADALRAVREMQHIRVFVSCSEAAEATREMLARQQPADPKVDIAVLVDSRLAPFGCVVESELGRMDAGLATRLAEARDTLIDAAAGERS